MVDIVNKIKSFPPMKRLLQQRGLKHYLSLRGSGFHYGRFKDFSEARNWLPKSKEFDFSDFANEYISDRSNKIYAFDYPVLLWLRHAFDVGARSVFDIGGSIGNQYYSYSKYIKYPTSFDWNVYELPVFAKMGREIALSRNASQLTFTDHLDMLQIDADVWIAAGAIEFMENVSIEGLLENSRVRPRHILLNKLPLHEGDEFVSTQNIGNGSFVPHHVFNRGKYITRVERCGYRLVDSWTVPDRRFVVPGHAELSFDEYAGLYFETK